MSAKNTPRKKSLKPFQILEPTQELNSQLVANIDPVQLYYEKDLEQAQQVLNHFTTSNLPEKLSFETFSKLFKLSKIALEFYIQEQEKCQIQLDEQKKQLQKLRVEDNKAREIKEKHNTKKIELKEQLKVFSQKVEELKEETSNSGSYKCLFCQKCYRDKDGLDSHIRRRHQEYLEKIIEDKNGNPQQVKEILKKLPDEELKEQRAEQMRRMRELQQLLIQQSKPTEEKLVQEVAKKIESDIEQKLFSIISNSQIKEGKNQSDKKEKKSEINEKEHKVEEENEEDKIKREEEIRKREEREKALRDEMLKMNEEVLQYQFKEKQEYLMQKQQEQSNLISQINKGQDELKKSTFFQNYSGNIVSHMQAPSFAEGNQFHQGSGGDTSKRLFPKSQDYSFNGFNSLLKSSDIRQDQIPTSLQEISSKAKSTRQSKSEDIDNENKDNQNRQENFPTTNNKKGDMIQIIDQGSINFQDSEFNSNHNNNKEQGINDIETDKSIDKSGSSEPNSLGRSFGQQQQEQQEQQGSALTKDNDIMVNFSENNPSSEQSNIFNNLLAENNKLIQAQRNEEYAASELVGNNADELNSNHLNVEWPSYLIKADENQLSSIRYRKDNDLSQDKQDITGQSSLQEYMGD